MRAAVYKLPDYTRNRSTCSAFDVTRDARIYVYIHARRLNTRSFHLLCTYERYRKPFRDFFPNDMFVLLLNYPILQFE